MKYSVIRYQSAQAYKLESCLWVKDKYCFKVLQKSQIFSVWGQRYTGGTMIALQVANIGSIPSILYVLPSLQGHDFWLHSQKWPLSANLCTFPQFFSVSSSLSSLEVLNCKRRQMFERQTFNWVYSKHLYCFNTNIQNSKNTKYWMKHTYLNKAIFERYLGYIYKS